MMQQQRETNIEFYVVSGPLITVGYIYDQFDDNTYRWKLTVKVELTISVYVFIARRLANRAGNWA